MEEGEDKEEVSQTIPKKRQIVSEHSLNPTTSELKRDTKAQVELMEMLGTREILEELGVELSGFRLLAQLSWLVNQALKLKDSGAS